MFVTACVAPDVAGQPLALRVASPLASINVGQPVGAPPPSYLREAEVPTPLDLIVLDVYGHELDALLGFDFQRWQPKLIVIADPIANLERHRFLKESGYRAIRRGSGRGWYVPMNAPVASERWAILRDYYLLLPFRKVWHALRCLKARIMAMPD